MKIQFLLIAISLCFCSATAQITTFKELQFLVINDVSKIKKILQAEGYSFYNSGEIMPHVKCDMWSSGNSSANRTVFGFGMVIGRYPVYVFIDTTYNFYRNTLKELKEMGYYQPYADEPELYKKSNDFVAIQKASYGYCYMLSKSDEWIKALQVAIAGDNVKKRIEKENKMK